MSEHSLGKSPALEAQQRRRRAPYALLSVLGLASIAVPKIALFTLLGAFLAFLSLSRPALRLNLWLLGVGALGSSVGFLRFLVTEAMPGIVQGGTSAAGSAAVSRLRTLLFAQDTLRKMAPIDPDGDRIGSAAFLGELLGRVGLRGAEPLSPPLLERYPSLSETRTGPAAEIAGYYFIVCLPARRGGFTADPSDAVDEERAERRFLAYAWPSQAGRGLSEAYFIDEHERILVAPSGQAGAAHQRTGASAAPRCDDALAPDSRGAWQAWRGKQARALLPGDPP